MTTRAGTDASTRRPPLVDGWSLAIIGLVALQPFASFLAENALKIVHPEEVLRDGVIWTVLVTIAFVGLRLATRSTPPLTVAAAFVAGSLSFWNFGRFLPYEPATPANRWIAIALWLLVTTLLVVLAVRLATLAAARTFLVLLLAVWTLGSFALYATARPAVASGDRPTSYAGPAFEPFVERPNVYWLMLDEHARSDQVRRWTGVDNSWFSDALTDRGFSTSESSQSGYLFTHLSLTSTLAMEYAFTPGHDYHSEYPLAVPFLAGDNPVVETFEANGYRYVFAPDGRFEWARCSSTRGDRTCIDPIGGALVTGEPRSNLMRSTPIGSFGIDSVHNDLDSVVDGVETLRADDPARPLFVFAHILSPHYPHRYEQDCSERQPWVEGLWFSGPERAAAYGNEVDCVDHDVVRAVDRLLVDDPNAVIIVQSDHGSSLTFNWSRPYEEWTAENFAERFGVVNAIRLPGSCRDRSIEGEPLVNTYRIVLACLAGTEPDLLETRTFFSGPISELREVPSESAPER